MSGGIYVASKTSHAAVWRKLQREGAPIISSWIHGKEGNLTDNEARILWMACVSEVQNADAMVLYCDEGEILKGAFVELGVALSMGVPVFFVGLPEALSFTHADGMTRCQDLSEAMELAHRRCGQEIGDIV